MRKIKEKTGSFIAKECSGRKHLILIFTDFIETTSSWGTHFVEGPKELITAHGISTERIAKGHYKVQGIDPVAPDIDIFSDDEKAP